MKEKKFILTVLAWMLMLSVSAFSESRYFSFGHLNQGNVLVTDAWAKLNTGTHSFTTITNGATLEVHVNSGFCIIKRGLTQGTGFSCVSFQVRIDDRPANYENQVALKRGENSAFLPIFAVFKNIPAGTHTVSLWAQTAPAGGIVFKVAVDCGGYGGAIIVKEN